jgi:RpiR family carbohydrate utilization transcriptional regulator
LREDHLKGSGNLVDTELTQPCILRIRSEYPQFREKEKKIADYILDNPKKIIHSSISQLAEDVQVAEATVFRFCKRIGFKGYQAMKITLASEIIEPIQDIHETLTANDDERTIADKVFRSNIRALEDTVQFLDPNHFKAAVEAILKANRIEFYGNGGSGIVALDAHHKFLRTGIPTIAYTDTHLQLMSASQLTDKDVVVLISHSGSNKDILSALRVAKENKTTTIGVTSLAKSPLSQHVDIPLYTIAQETEYRSEAFASRLAQLCIIDALYVNISIRRQDSMKSSLQKMRKAIAVKRL